MLTHYQYQIPTPLNNIAIAISCLRRDIHVNLKVSSKDAYIDEG